MCPGHDESGGKRLGGKTRKGNRWLRQALVEVEHVASQMKQTHLAAQSRHIVARRGKNVSSSLSATRFYVSCIRY
jgi:transposase